MRDTWFLFVGAFIMAAVFVALWWAEPARAHEWYPLECCSQRDCFPLDQAAVERHADGYYVRPLKRTIPYAKANTSPDGQYPLCVLDPQRSPWELRASPRSPPASQWLNRSNVCFFAPPGGV